CSPDPRPPQVRSGRQSGSSPASSAVWIVRRSDFVSVIECVFPLQGPSQGAQNGSPAYQRRATSLAADRIAGRVSGARLLGGPERSTSTGTDGGSVVWQRLHPHVEPPCR